MHGEPIRLLDLYYSLTIQYIFCCCFILLFLPKDCEIFLHLRAKYGEPNGLLILCSAIQYFSPKPQYTSFFQSHFFGDYFPSTLCSWLVFASTPFKKNRFGLYKLLFSRNLLFVYHFTRPLGHFTHLQTI